MKDVKELLDRIGYEFKDTALLTNALTHSSYSSEHKMEYASNNERLEFIGDAYVDAAVGAELFRIMKDAPEGVEVHYAAYLPEELAKLEALSQYVEYGQIIFGGVEEPLHLELKDPAMNTHTVFIKDLDQAIQEAQNFAKAGVDGIELCSSFDLDMTKQIIAAVEAIDPKIPVGSNGITV